MTYTNTTVFCNIFVGDPSTQGFWNQWYCTLGLLLSTFSQCCVACSYSMFGNGPWDHLVALWIFCAINDAHTFAKKSPEWQWQCFSSSSWSGHQMRGVFTPMCDTHLLNILEMVGWDTLNRYATSFSSRLKARLTLKMATIQLCDRGTHYFSI